MGGFNFSFLVKDRVLEIENHIHPVPNVWVHYRLYDQEQNIVRKGTFSGKKVQMRLADLPEGDYKLELLNKEAHIANMAVCLE
jgi:hypothetical protein